MVDRPPDLAALSRRWALLLLLAGGCAPPHTAARTLRAGELAPPLLAASGPGDIRVTWVFAGRDLVRCRSSARELRHLSARFGGSVQLQGIAIDADSELVRSFMRVQRISPAVVYVRRAGAAEVRMLTFPALYVVRGSRVERVYPGVPPDDDASMRSRDVEQVVSALLGRSKAVPLTLTKGDGA